MSQLLSKEERLAAYEKALAWYTADEQNNTGLCVVLGRSHWRNFMDSPLTYWYNMEEYFPEIFIQGHPYPHNTSYEKTRNRRIFWLENAIMQLTQPIN
jgi:hypothetical protein